MFRYIKKVLVKTMSFLSCNTQNLFQLILKNVK